MLEAWALNFSYGKTPILTAVDFQAGRGQVVTLLGPNGSEKFTLLRCLARLLPAPANAVLVAI